MDQNKTDHNSGKNYQKNVLKELKEDTVAT